MAMTTVLSVRALGLGDLLAAVPALRAIGRAFPGHTHVLAAPAALEPIVRLIDGVDDLVDARPLVPPPVGSADVLVNLHGQGPESHRAALATRPRRLIAFAHDDVPETAGQPRWRPYEHERRRWCRLLTESGIPADPDDLHLRQPGRAPRAEGAAIVHPGAAAPARRWPLERFAALARREQRIRPVLVTGSRAEAPLAHEIARRAGLSPRAVLAGRTDLVELAALVATAARVISGDTGIAHLAVALGTPSLTLYGPVPPSEWGPPPHDVRHRTLWSGFRGDPDAPGTDPGLAAITTAQALHELERLGSEEVVSDAR
jgi:ADP-heptose:LPS heptosyltransferase